MLKRALNNSSIISKIWFGILIILLGYIASMLTFHFCSQMITEHMNKTSEARFPAAKLSQEILNGFRNHIKLFNDSVLLGDEEHLNSAKEIGKECLANLLQLETLFDKIGQDKTELLSLTREFESYEEQAIKVYEKMAAGEGNEEIYKTAAILATQKDEIENKLVALEKQSSQNLLKNLKNVSAYLTERTQFNWKLFIVVFFSCLIIVRIIINRFLVKPLAEITTAAKEMEKGNFAIELQSHSQDEMGTLVAAFSSMANSQLLKIKLAESIAHGDLSQQITLASDNDMLGQALLKMVKSLNKVMRQINETATQVVTKADQMSGASQSLSEGAIKSASSLEEISGSVSEVETKTRANAENAGSANALAINTREAAEVGNKQMDELTQSIVDIQNESKDISKIIKVIDDIAFQTNLLALNAAVEAARAGRHGRGFAVVADEVRNLASRSARAAKETSEIITSSEEKVAIGTELAKKTSSSLENIVKTAIKVTDLVAEISYASSEQSNSITQISQGLAQIDQITQQNASNSEETAAASEELTTQAYELKAQLEKFKLNDD